MAILLNFQVGVIKAWKIFSKRFLHGFHAQLSKEIDVSLNSGIDRSDNRKLGCKCRLSCIFLLELAPSRSVPSFRFRLPDGCSYSWIYTAALDSFFPHLLKILRPIHCCATSSFEAYRSDTSFDHKPLTTGLQKMCLRTSRDPDPERSPALGILFPGN